MPKLTLTWAFDGFGEVNLNLMTYVLYQELRELDALKEDARHRSFPTLLLVPAMFARAMGSQILNLDRLDTLSYWKQSELELIQHWTGLYRTL
jgi:hypothetical protein